MNFNICGTCGACDGRAGNLFGHEGSDVNNCENCRDSLLQNSFVIHTHLKRTKTELDRMMTAVEQHNKPEVTTDVMVSEVKVVYDISKNKLDIGDKVVSIWSNYDTCSLRIGTVLGFTAQKVRIEFDEILTIDNKRSIIVVRYPTQVSKLSSFTQYLSIKV